MRSATTRGRIAAVDLGVDGERADFERALRTLEALGVEVKGHRAALWEASWETPRLVVEHGLAYDSSLSAFGAQVHQQGASVDDCRVSDRPGGLAALLAAVADANANVIAVEHVRDGVELAIREIRAAASISCSRF
jgi:hypothetical protein